MNWGKILLTGGVGGIVLNLYQWLMHGFILRSTYESYAVFGREPANPAWFFVVAIAIGIAGAMLFSKTRSAWGEGAKGGVMFGAFVGLIVFFGQFYFPLVINEFPYYLAWCWGAIAMIGWIIFGAVASFFIKS